MKNRKNYQKIGLILSSFLLLSAFAFHQIEAHLSPKEFGFAMGETAVFYEGKHQKQEFYLLAQSQHCNLWYDGQPFGDYVFQENDTFSHTLLEEVDKVYQRLSHFIPHKNVIFQGKYLPLMGDLDRDGRINVFLYHHPDGLSYFTKAMFLPTWNSPAVDGFFLADSVVNPQFRGEEIRLNPQFSSAVAHEMQHLFYAMYISNEDLTWFNEMLSAFADLFYSQEEGLCYFPFDGDLSFLEGDYFQFHQSEADYLRSYSVAFYIYQQINPGFLEDIYAIFQENLVESHYFGQKVYKRKIPDEEDLYQAFFSALGEAYFHGMEGIDEKMDYFFQEYQSFWRKYPPES